MRIACRGALCAGLLAVAMSGCDGARKPNSVGANPELKAMIARAEAGDRRALDDLPDRYARLGDVESAVLWHDRCIKAQAPRCLTTLAEQQLAEALDIDRASPGRREQLLRAKASIDLANVHADPTDAQGFSKLLKIDKEVSAEMKRLK
jgi:hypothetical protein